MSGKVLWAIAEWDWDLFRDDLGEVTSLTPVKVFTTAEAAMEAVNIDYKNGWSEEDDTPFVPLTWALKDEEWTAEIRHEPGPGGTLICEHSYTVYPVILEE